MPENIFHSPESLSAEEEGRLDALGENVRAELLDPKVQERAKQAFENLLMEFGASGEDASFTSEYIVVELMKQEGSFREIELALAAVIASATGKEENFFRERLRKELLRIFGNEDEALAT